jgi:subtilisin family serine protease
MPRSANARAYVYVRGTWGAQSIWSPGVAKNALTIGNVQDSGSNSVGELSGTSSRGPTGDSRMKPDLVATGAVVTSAQAGTTDGYVDKSGCSMATPHVSGIAATLLEHYLISRTGRTYCAPISWRPLFLHSDEVNPTEQHRLGAAMIMVSVASRLSIAAGRGSIPTGGVGTGPGLTYHRQVVGLL